MGLSNVDPNWSWVYDSLVAAWLFTEPADDTVRDVYNRANGTRVAGTGTKPTWDRDGELWGLTPIVGGATSGIDLPIGDASPLGDSFTPEQLSVETWSKWPTSGSDPRLFSKQTGGNEEDHFIMVGAVTADNPRMRLATGGATTTHVGATNVEPVAGDLVHTIWTYNGADIQLYLNAVDTQIITGGSQTGTVDGGTDTPMRIGNAAQAGATNEWDAPIYKVAVYDVALSQSQATALFYDPYGPHRIVHRFVGKVAAVGGARPQGPLGHPFHGPFAGPVN